MLSKQYRLKKRSDFQEVWRLGTKAKGQLIIMRAHQTSNECPRFAFIVSKKVSKKAVIRNRIKRTITEVVRQNISSVKGGYDVIVVALPQIAGTSSIKIKEDVLNTIKKI